MSFIKISKQLYRQVEALEKETSDHEISMARGELETIADKALATSAMLEGTPENGNPLPAWVQSKITNACDYITTVHDYLKYNPRLNESFEITESTFEKIYQMQQDGKSSEDIAKELKLNPALVKKVLGEQVELKEFNDAQIALLKKEFDPLKNKQISTARANQLSNILDKLDDGSLQKLRDALIPFVSAVSAAKLTTRKFKGVKITNVKVPGLEGMAEENQYVAVHTKKGKTSVTANSSYEAAKKASEKFGLNNTTGITVMLAKKDGEDVIHKATEEIDLEEGAKRYKEMSNVGTAKYVVSFHDGIKKHNDGSDFFDVEIFKNKEEKNKFITDLDRKGYRPIKYVDEEVELKPVPSLEDSAKKHKVDVEVLKKQLEKGIQVEKEHTKDEKTAEKIALAHIDERPDYYIQIDKLEKKPIQKVNEGAKLTYESLEAVKNKAEKSGMPYSILKQVYDRGMAAWKGGHRPGAGQHQWALARVNSFVTKSSGTWGGADSDLAKKVKGD
jgi:predicted DNA binding CopG/RHH family protein